MVFFFVNVGQLWDKLDIAWWGIMSLGLYLGRTQMYHHQQGWIIGIEEGIISKVSLHYHKILFFSFEGFYVPRH